MTATISPTQSIEQAALTAFLLSVLGLEPTQIVGGQPNRLPEPRTGSFVVMTPMRYERLRTNIDTDADCKFTGAIAGTALAVADVATGAIAVGATVFGTGVTTNTKVTAQVSGPAGGAGVYTVSASQTVGSRTLSAGSKVLEQGAMVTIRLEFHSDDLSASDMAQIVSTALRDPYGVQFFSELAPPKNGVVPLYADDPRQSPFFNEGVQVEWRWTLEANFQVNQRVAVPQQYADAVDVDVVNVDATYPPA